MKGLMFNLLESLARDAGCSEEAWELVAEFAAADSVWDKTSLTSAPNAGTDICPAHVFEVPTEAMLTCLAKVRDTAETLEATVPGDLLDLEDHSEWLGVQAVNDLIPSLCDVLPRAGAGFEVDAFRTAAEVEADAQTDYDDKEELEYEGFDFSFLGIGQKER